MNLKGTLPTLVLQIIARQPRHGYAIAQEIKRTSKGVLDFKEGTLYPALHGLEARGLLQGYEEVEQGRTRRYYKITEAGADALSGDVKQWRDWSQAINLLLEET